MEEDNQAQEEQAANLLNGGPIDRTHHAPKDIDVEGGVMGIFGDMGLDSVGNNSEPIQGVEQPQQLLQQEQQEQEQQTQEPQAEPEQELPFESMSREQLLEFVQSRAGGEPQDQKFLTNLMHEVTNATAALKAERERTYKASRETILARQVAEKAGIGPVPPKNEDLAQMDPDAANQAIAAYNNQYALYENKAAAVRQEFFRSEVESRYGDIVNRIGGYDVIDKMRDEFAANPRLANSEEVLAFAALGKKLYQENLKRRERADRTQARKAGQPAPLPQMRGSGGAAQVNKSKGPRLEKNPLGGYIVKGDKAFNDGLAKELGRSQVAQDALFKMQR